MQAWAACGSDVPVLCVIECAVRGDAGSQVEHAPPTYFCCAPIARRYIEPDPARAVAFRQLEVGQINSAPPRCAIGICNLPPCAYPRAGIYGSGRCAKPARRSLSFVVLLLSFSLSFALSLFPFPIPPHSLSLSYRIPSSPVSVVTLTAHGRGAEG